MGELAAERVQTALATFREQQLDSLENAMSERRAASGLEETWAMAVEGRVHVLLVEDGFTCPAVVSEDALRLSSIGDPAAPGARADAVDDLIEMVTDRGGVAYFVAAESLKDHGGVAAILRY